MTNGVTRRWMLRAACRLPGHCLARWLRRRQYAGGAGLRSLQTPGDATGASAKELVKVALILPISAAGHPGLIGKSLKQAAELALFERDNPDPAADRQGRQGHAGRRQGCRRGGREGRSRPHIGAAVCQVRWRPWRRSRGRPAYRSSPFSNDRQVAGNGVFLLSFQPGPDVERVVSYAATQGKRRFVALVPEDPFGKIAEAAFKEAAARSQVTLVAIERYPAIRQRHAGADAPHRCCHQDHRGCRHTGRCAVPPGGQDNLEMIGRLLPQAEIDTEKVKLVGTGGMDYPNAGRDPRLAGAWYPGPDPRGWTDFAQKYAKSYNQSPPRIASLAYDAVSWRLPCRSAARAVHAGAADAEQRLHRRRWAFRLLPDGTTERALAILEVQKFGTGVLDPARSPRSSRRPPPPASAPR
jgi:hypothetical protein